MTTTIVSRVCAFGVLSLSMALVALPLPAMAGISIVPTGKTIKTASCTAMPFDAIRQLLVDAQYREPRLVGDAAAPLVVDASHGPKRLRLLVDGCTGEVIDIQPRPRT